ncbi:MAG: tyrosine-type recombinase/integrase [Bacteroidia bacterium]
MPHPSNILESFKAYLAIRGLSTLTIEAYERSFRQLADFCQTHHAFSPWENLQNLQKLSSEILQAWLSTFEHPTTRAHKIAALRSLHHFAVETFGKGFPYLPALPKLPKTLPKAIPQTTLQTLWETLPHPHSPDQIRDRLILELLYACGLRRAEVTSLTYAHLNLYENILTLRGKGKKWRTVPFSPFIKELFTLYLEAFPHARHSPYLFTTPTGKRLYPSYVYRLVKNLLGYHPHQLRHSFATHILENQGSVLHVQKLLGHKNLNTTQKYLKVTLPLLQEAYQQYHPRAKKMPPKEGGVT